MAKDPSTRSRGIVAKVKSCLSPTPPPESTEPLPASDNSMKPKEPEENVKPDEPTPQPLINGEKTEDDHPKKESEENEAEPAEENLKVEDVLVTQHLEMPHNMSADVKLTLAMFAKAITGIGFELLRLSNEWEAGTFARAYEYEDFPTRLPTRWPLVPRHVVSLPKAEAFSSHKIGRVVERAHEFIRAQMPLLARLDEPKHEMFADLGHDAYRAFFNSELFPMPKMLLDEEKNYWMDDERFTDQFLNGCNPIIITRVTEDNINRMPAELRAEEDPQGRGVDDLMEKGLLYAADYAVLATPGIAGGIDECSGSFTNAIRFDSVSTAPSMKKHFYAPYVAFYQDCGKLKILGITLTRSKNRPNTVYNPRTCAEKPNIYAFAKMHVSCADNQFHQFYSHLGRCHLIFEPFGIAVRNIFDLGDETAQKHVVGRLLSPHFKDHMAINWLARNTLVAHEEGSIPFTDAGFAVGSKGGLRLLAAKYASWKLHDQSFPNQLKNRGFDPEGKDGLEYYYRSDGMMIWKALKKYVVMALEDFYESSNSSEKIAAEERNLLVRQDQVLEKWCEEMRARKRAAVRSFPKKFTSIEGLAETVTTIIYNVSAEHAAVNYAQLRYLSYVPNRPNALFQPVADISGPDMGLVGQILMIHRARGDDDDIGASQPLGFAMFQVQFSQLLTMPPEETLVDLKPEGVSQRAIDRLQYDLKRTHYEIASRNMRIEEETPHLPPYEFLDPVNIAQSIEI